MRRKRYQKGSVGARKHGKTKVWVGQWWDNGHKKSKVLGKCSEVSKGQAEALLVAILQPLNQVAGLRQAPVYTFERYVKSVFLPLCKRKWKPSTWMTTEPVILGHLVPTFGSRLLADITREEMQAFLEAKASERSTSLVAHLRWHLSAIFKMALGDGVVQVNPTLGLYIPEGVATPEKRILTEEEILLALDALELRERLIFELAVFSGMRPGEILAVRMRNLHRRSIHIEQRVYRGLLGTPKGRKGKRTERVIGLSPATVEDLAAWRERYPETSPDAFLFPSENLKKPVSRDNLWRRYMEPKLAEVGLEWATFQVLRRTNASLGEKANVKTKVAADQRGHGIGVSLEVYTVSPVDQKIEAVTKLESLVISKRKPSEPRESQAVA